MLLVSKKTFKVNIISTRMKKNIWFDDLTHKLNQQPISFSSELES